MGREEGRVGVIKVGEGCERNGFVGENIDCRGNVVKAFGNALDGDVVFERVFEVNGQRLFHQGCENDDGIACEEIEDCGGLDAVIERKVSRAVCAFTARDLGDTVLERFVKRERVIDTALFGARQAFLVVVDENRHCAVVD